MARQPTLLACGVLLFLSRAVPHTPQHHAIARVRPPCAARAALLRLRGGAAAAVCDREGLQSAHRGSVGLDGVRASSGSLEGRCGGKASPVETWGDWSRFLSKRTGKHYWYNKRTRATQWRDPRGSDTAGRDQLEAQNSTRDCGVVDGGAAEGSAPDGAGEGLETNWELPKRDADASGGGGPALEENEPEDVWTVHVSKKNGQPYWFNKFTGKSQWTDPKIDLEDAREEAAEQMGLKWGAGKRSSYDGGSADAERRGLGGGGGGSGSIQLGGSSMTTDSQAPASSLRHAHALPGSSSFTAEMVDEHGVAERSGELDIECRSSRDAGAQALRHATDGGGAATAQEAGARVAGNATAAHAHGRSLVDSEEEDSDAPRRKSARMSVFRSKGASTAVGSYRTQPDADNDDSEFLYTAFPNVYEPIVEPSVPNPSLKHMCVKSDEIDPPRRVNSTWSMCRRELEEYAGIDKDRERERERGESYHEIWRRERAQEVARENFICPSTSNLKSSSHRIGGHKLTSEAATGGTSSPSAGPGVAHAAAEGRALGGAQPSAAVTWDSDSEEDSGGCAGRIRVADFLHGRAAVPSGGGGGTGSGGAVGAAGEADKSPGEEEGAEAGEEKEGVEGGRSVAGVTLPQTGFFGAGTMEQEAARYAASSMQWRDRDADDDDGEREDSAERLKREERQRQDRERARLSKLEGLLNGDVSALPPAAAAAAAAAAKGTGDAEHYSAFLRPARPQQAGTHLYKNSGAPTAQNFEGRAKAADGWAGDDETQQDMLRSKARAAAGRFGGALRRIQWDASIKCTIRLRPCWFVCKKGHEFLATLADLEKHEQVWSHMDWCPTCEKKSKIKAAERFNGRPDESWAHFFERVDHIRPDSHRFAESRMAAEQAHLFETARQHVADGTEKLEDWWNVDKDLPSRDSRRGAAEPMAKPAENMTPAQEVDRVMAFLRHKESLSGHVAIQSYNLAEICGLLGLPQRAAADPDALRRHYRRLVLVLHPDKNPHAKANDAFAAVQQAFEQLSAIQALSRGKK